MTKTKTSPPQRHSFFSGSTLILYSLLIQCPCPEWDWEDGEQVVMVSIWLPLSASSSLTFPHLHCGSSTWLAVIQDKLSSALVLHGPQGGYLLWFDSLHRLQWNTCLYTQAEVPVRRTCSGMGSWQVAVHTGNIHLLRCEAFHKLQYGYLLWWVGWREIPSLESAAQTHTLWSDTANWNWLFGQLLDSSSYRDHPCSPPSRKPCHLLPKRFVWATISSFYSTQSMGSIELSGDKTFVS